MRPRSDLDLTVVVAATDGPDALARTLGSLGARSGRVEVIVAAPWAAQGAVDGVRHLEGPPGSGAPRLRALGLDAAGGRVVAFLEDSVVAEAGWLDAWLAAFEGDPGLAAGSGGVEHDRAASAVDWAVVFAEYAPFLPRRAGSGPEGGPPPRLAGNHFAATRAAALRASAGGEVHEVALLASVRARGGRWKMVAGAGVRHVRTFEARRAIADRFRFGLEFGRLRAGSGSKGSRWLGPAAGPWIFGAQVGKVARAAWGSRHRREFARALPITLALLAAWSLGEWLGWTLGPSPTRRAGRPGGGGRPLVGPGRSIWALRRGP